MSRPPHYAWLDNLQRIWSPRPCVTFRNKPPSWSVTPCRLFSTVKWKLTVRRAQLPLMCMFDSNRLHVSTLQTGHLQAFT
jgi:hypothetical protein